MSPLTYLPAALACLFSLPTLAETAATGPNSPVDALTTSTLQTCAKPVWPAESLKREEEGTVVLAYLIGLDGRVIESKVEKSSGHPLLDFAAQDGLAKCLFASPETIGRHEPTWTRMSYLWTLEGGETPAESNARLEKDIALAAAGDASGIYYMSARYFEGNAGVRKDVPEALRLLRKSAEMGLAQAQVSLAVVLFGGKDVDKDVAQAIVWAKKSAAQGDPLGQTILAGILFNAPEEFQDDDLMFDMLEKAVSQGNSDAKNMLGNLLIGLEGRDRQRGLQLIVDAAEAQNRIAQDDLALLFEEGDVLPKDLVRAMALYERAAAGGYRPAKDALLRLQH